MSRWRQLDEFTVLRPDVEFSRLAQVREAQMPAKIWIHQDLELLSLVVVRRDPLAGPRSILICFPSSRPMPRTFGKLPLFTAKASSCSLSSFPQASWPSGKSLPSEASFFCVREWAIVAQGHRYVRFRTVAVAHWLRTCWIPKGRRRFYELSPNPNFSCVRLPDKA